MACSPVRVMVLMSLILGAVRGAAAQERVLVGGAAYESPSLVAPLAVLISRPASDVTTWTVGFTGYTLRGEYARRVAPSVTAVWSADATPVDANHSRYVYRDGQRDPALAFEDGSYHITAGFNLDGTSPWHASARAIGLYETVSGLADSAVLARWRSPYVGLEIVTSYRRVVSERVVEGRWHGIKVAAAAAGFLGARSWWRSQLSVSAGKGVGRVDLSGETWLLVGGGLDIVNAFLVGGSWDMADRPALYGYHYAEFRPDRAGVANGGADFRLVGATSLGIRAACLASPSKGTCGGAVRLATVWDGIAASIGIGVPASGTTIVFASFSAAAL